MWDDILLLVFHRLYTTRCIVGSPMGPAVSPRGPINPGHPQVPSPAQLSEEWTPEVGLQCDFQDVPRRIDNVLTGVGASDA